MRRSIILLRPLITGVLLTAIISLPVFGRTIYLDDKGPADSLANLVLIYLQTGQDK